MGGGKFDLEQPFCIAFRWRTHVCGCENVEDMCVCVCAGIFLSAKIGECEVANTGTKLRPANPVL